jgi:hypothetical protein
MRNIVKAAVVGLGITAVMVLGSGVAQAKPVSDELKREACSYMDALDLTGEPMMQTVVAFLQSEHRGMDDGTAAWAIVHGVQDVCDWHADDLPPYAKKYVG